MTELSLFKQFAICSVDEFRDEKKSEWQRPRRFAFLKKASSVCERPADSLTSIDKMLILRCAVGRYVVVAVVLATVGYRDRKCADTIGSVLVPRAGRFQC